MDALQFRADLLAHTRMIKDLVDGKITMRAFVSQYGDFYYVAALDGHEAGAGDCSVLERYATVRRFHEAVQYKVLDQLVTEEEWTPALGGAGRLVERDGLERVRSLAAEYRLDELVQDLVTS